MNSRVTRRSVATDSVAVEGVSLTRMPAASQITS